MKKMALLMAIAVLSSPFSMADGKSDVDARQKIFKDFKKTFGSMGDMVKKPESFDAATFNQLAIHLNTIAEQPWQHFTTASSKENSDAKAEIWTDNATFKQAAQKFQANTKNLKDAAATNQLENIKVPFGAVGQSCKNCHDSFRK